MAATVALVLHSRVLLGAILGYSTITERGEVHITHKGSMRIPYQVYRQVAARVLVSYTL